MAKKAAKKTVKKNRAASRVRRVNTHKMFDASKNLKNDAQEVLDKLEGTPEQAERLKKFIAELEDIQLSIKGACETIEGGNPMFHDFKVKP